MSRQAFFSYLQKVTVSIGSGTNLNLISTFTGSGVGATAINCGTLPANCLVVVSIAGGTSGNNSFISDTKLLTFTKRADASAGSSGDCEIWTAPNTTSGAEIITANIATSKNSICIYVFGNPETTFGTTGVTATAQSQPSAIVTTTRSNSIIVGVISSFNGVDGGTNGASTTYRDTVVQDFYFRDAADHTSWFFHKNAATATSYTEGFTAPTGAQGGTCLLEIRGN